MHKQEQIRVTTHTDNELPASVKNTSPFPVPDHLPRPTGVIDPEAVRVKARGEDSGRPRPSTGLGGASDGEG
jgi:hypothetical protein